MTYKFDWNGDTKVDQTFTFSVVPDNITLNKDNTVNFQTKDGVVVIKDGEAVHTHSYEVKFDANGHWQECACGDKTEAEAHTYGEWTVTKPATETEKGERKHTCTVCGYAETEEISATGTTEEPSDPEENPKDPEQPADPESKPEDKPAADEKPSTDAPQTGDNSSAIAWIAVMLVAGAGMTGTLVYSRKRKHSR